ncbi:MAG: Gfo/Idh/MocA family oxidoreductase [Chitinophagaceae bacterium]
MEKSRRDFLNKTISATAVISFGGILPAFSAKSYNNISGANDKIKVASMGVNSRGLALGTNFASQPNCEVLYVCDVDVRAADKFINAVDKIQHQPPKAQPDFRKALEDKNLDVLVVAAPDHWHAPAAILACQAGKHVYLEKPCSHNPNEGELLVKVANKYNRLLQMGNQLHYNWHWFWN